MKKYAGPVRTNRARLLRWLDARSIPYVRSSANFILTRVGERAPEIAQRLRDHEILVRDWSYDPHLKGYLRFTSAPGANAPPDGNCRGAGDLIETPDGERAWKNLVSILPTGWFA